MSFGSKPAMTFGILYPCEKISNGFIVKLCLKNSKLIKSSEFISNLKSLRVLKLNFCSLYEIPNSLGTLSFLKVFELKRNNLQLIPKSIGNFYFLKILNLSKNKMKKFFFF